MMPPPYVANVRLVDALTEILEGCLVFCMVLIALVAAGLWRMTKEGK